MAIQTLTKPLLPNRQRELVEEAQLSDPETSIATTLSPSPLTRPLVRNRSPRVRMETLLRAARIAAVRQKRISKEIFDRIQSESPGRIRCLTVHCNQDGTYVLHGWCTSYHSKQIAQHEAMRLISGRDLTNSIEVLQVTG